MEGMARRDARDRERQAAHILDQLRAAIAREPLLLRLGSQQELADHFGVALRVVRDALASLEREGLIAATRGGYRVVDRPGPEQAGLQQVVVAAPSPIAYSLFVQNVVLGIDRRCRELRLNLKVRWLSANHTDEQLEEIAALYPGPHVGWVWLYGCLGSAELTRRWLSRGRRIVVLEEIHPEVPLPGVVLNHFAAARLAGQALRRMGHRRFGLITGANVYDVELGETILSQVIGLQGPGDDALHHCWTHRVPYIYHPAYVNSIPEMLERLREPGRPTALVVHNAVRADKVRMAVEAAGFRIPDDLSIIGIGARLQEPSDLAAVTLASAGSALELGGRAVDQLSEPPEPDARPPTIRLAAFLEGEFQTLGPAPK